MSITDLSLAPTFSSVTSRATHEPRRRYRGSTKRSMKTIAVVAVIVFATAIGRAQEHPKITLIRQILGVTDARANLERMRIDNVAQTRAALFAQAGARATDPTLKRMLNRAMEKYNDFSKEIFDWGKLEEEYITLYDEAFSESELHGLLDFYNTDAGRASLRSLPLILSKMQQRVFSHQAENSARVDRILKESALEVQAEIKTEDAKQSAYSMSPTVLPPSRQESRQP
jgi:uncharacterized protein